MVLVTEEGYGKRVMCNLLKQTLEDSEYTDVVLQVDESKFYLHSSVLVETCPEMLENIKKSCKTTPVNSEKRYSAKLLYSNSESSSETNGAGAGPFFSEVIRFLYTGQIDLTAMNKDKIRTLSSKLQIKDLEHLCDIYEENMKDDRTEEEVDAAPMDHEYYTKSMETAVSEVVTVVKASNRAKETKKRKAKSDQYECLHCGEGYNDVEKLNVHYQNCQPKNIMCCKCGKSFSDMVQYSSGKHSCFSNQMEINKVEEVICEYCFKAFHDPDALVIHEEGHKCEKCNKFFTSTEKVKDHSCGDPGQMSVYECNECNKTYTKKQYFLNHQRSTHLKTGHVCTYCGKVLTNEKYLEKHILTHTGGKSQTEFKCTVCSQEFKYEIYLFRHYINEKHLVDQIPYRCLKCDKVVPSQGILNKHMKDHVLRSYPCEECEKSYSSKSALQLHISNVHATEFPYKCKHCNRSFAQHTNLRAHMKELHEQSGELVCSFCGQKMSSKMSLKRHESRHSGVREFNCKICNKTFAVSSDLVRHIRLRHPKLLNVCECGKTFKSTTGLEMHRQRLHYGRSKPKSRPKAVAKPETDDTEDDEEEEFYEEEAESVDEYVLEETMNIYEV